jgi:ketosteroid isomerase-like protein
MSEQNAEIVRRFFGAIQRSLDVWDRSRSIADGIRDGDVPQETRDVLSYVSPDMDWNPIFSTETYHGYVEMGRGLDELLEAAGDYRLELRDVTDLDDDRVFVVFRPTLEGRSSGIHMDIAVFGVVALQDGLIVRIDEYIDRREAVEAAGGLDRLSSG